MTQGECVFYLREIRSRWGSTKVSGEKLGELAAANLIEIQAEPVFQVRLTSTGEKYKIASRSHYHTTLPVVSAPLRPRKVRSWAVQHERRMSKITSEMA